MRRWRAKSNMVSVPKRVGRSSRGPCPHPAKVDLRALNRRGVLTRSRHRAEAFQIEAQAGPGSGIPPAKMSQRVSLSDGEGLLPSLCSDEPRAERTDQRVRQRSTHRVRDFVFARFAERPVFARPNLWCMIFIDRERHGVIEQTEARSWAAKMSPNGNSAAMHAAIEPRRAGAE